MKIKALPNKVLVSHLELGTRVVNGIIIPNDDGKSEGIRSRWAKVYSVGENIDEITVGQWVLIEHGRWTRMLTVKDEDGTEVRLWGAEWPESELMVSDEEPQTAIFSKWV